MKTFDELCKEMLDELNKTHTLDALRYCLAPTIYELSAKGDGKQVEFPKTVKSFDQIMKEYYFEEEIKQKCECGRDKVGEGIHSDWCPKYKENI